MKRRKIVTGLDIGTTKICALIAEVSGENNIEIVGIGLAPSNGLRKGIVVDIDKTSHAIKSAVQKAERMAGQKVDSAYVGIAGSHIKSINSHGVVAVTGDEKEIKESDIKRVIDAARIVPVSAEEDILHVLPREFIVDGSPGIQDPLGMSGVRLEVETHIIKGASTSIQNLVKSVLRAGLSVDEVVLEPLASSQAVLSDDEKDLGAVLVDIGGGTTDVIVFHEGSIAHTSVLPVGGNHVSNDIAVGLRTPVSEAEKIKIMHGSVLPGEIDDQEKIEVLAASGKERKKLSRKMLCQVIEPRMTEVFSMIKKELNSAGSADLTPAGMILTGGASLLEGSEKLASDITELPVRIGEPDYVSGLSNVIDNPVYIKKGDTIPRAIFSTAVGLIEFALENGDAKNNNLRSNSSNNSKEIVSGFFSKLKSWFSEFF
ncbi:MULTISPECIES: cell division protein FtsA [Halanaerobium]|uniref:Cell division protein FtsA n=1 Tax=Halanaerobium saccharolyticum TaxID=43595 RepID=A0A4R6S8T8_9FIRM|nr:MULTISPECIES: cell division protein FtsA [Halanaerobium]PUU87882.1 MAG: cell division protein FtsA [Halanaerobium sp.]PUU88057.1 MAG: cell division protein FtsA [Halanaerobium sp.]TDP95285.1 cell division protein FtsA [Halanaerobium saccharolyticum]